MATHTNDNGSSTITNINTLRLIALCEIHIEIVIHWLEWFSNICQNQTIMTSSSLSCMFCKLVDINEPTGVEHPRLSQLTNDLRLLHFIEDLAEYADEIINEPMILNTNSMLNHTFTNTDFNIIRHRFVAPAIPPHCITSKTLSIETHNNNDASDPVVMNDGFI